jgi:hypothetical protein
VQFTVNRRKKYRRQVQHLRYVQRQSIAGTGLLCLGLQLSR